MKQCPRCARIDNDPQRFCKSCNTELFFAERFVKSKRSLLTLYFSGTGNAEYIAKLFSHKMGARCLSIEASEDFTGELKSHDTIVFCYPIYGSRVPRIMREFVVKHMADLSGKKLAIFATQWLFSGDGARVFTDMFWEGTIEVIYAEHFNMPNNVSNMPFLGRASKRRIAKYKRNAETKMDRVCSDIKQGIVKKRGFSRFSKWLGNIQGKWWQGDSKEPYEVSGMEHKAKSRVKVHDGCTACNLCVSICPMKNLANRGGAITHSGNCTVCYRCVNRCPKQAITVLFHRKPRWQYF